MGLRTAVAGARPLAGRRQGEKIEAIQALRGVAVLAVVAFHSLVFERKYSGGDLVLPGWFRFGESGVDLFFVISGFVMVTVSRGRFGKLKEVFRFLWSRATRIYPTYWFYFFVTLSVLLWRPSWVNTSLYQQADLLSSFLLLPSDRLPLVVVAWSLVHELWFYLVFGLLLLFREKALVPFLCAWAAAILAINLLADTSTFAPTARIVTHPYTCEFIIGSLAALLVRVEPISKLPAGLFWGLIVVVVIGLIQADAADILAGSRLKRALVIGGLYGSLLAACVVLEAKGSLRVPTFLRMSGDISYTVYLSHVLVLSAIGRIWLAIGSASGPADNVLAFVILITAIMVYGWIAYRLIEKPMVDLSHRLRARLIGSAGAVGFRARWSPPHAASAKADSASRSRGASEDGESCRGSRGARDG